MKPGMSRYLAAVLLISMMPAGVLQAGDETAWQGTDKGRVRLVAGAKTAEGTLYAGLQFDLAQGWKTYWRVPGDSGIPPVFNWEASKNVAHVDVLMPAPQRFRDDFGWNNGYKDDTLFPIRIRPHVDSEPVQLELAMFYGVCRQLCIPGKAQLSLTIPAQGRSSHQARIDRYLRMVPKPAGEVDGLKISSVRVAEEAGEVSMLVGIGHVSPDLVSLFVEGPDSFYFARPEMQNSDETTHSHFKVRVDGAQSAESLEGAKLVFTAVQGDLRLQQDWNLD